MPLSQLLNSASYYTDLQQAVELKLSKEQQLELKQALEKSEAKQLAKLFDVSLYARRELERRPELLLALLNHMQLGVKLERYSYKELMQVQLIHLASIFKSSEDDSIRLWRHLAQLRIIWRDSNGLSSLFETTKELSFLAELCIQHCVDRHYHELSQSYGVPRCAEGKKQDFYVLGMGKLGAWELNLSSDIDLIFAYPEKGETDGDKSVENQQFFTLLGKRVIQSLDAQTTEGRAFRVDMRLRPWGQSGALVSSFGALETYYQSQGREWERYAMIKARIVAHSGEGARSDEMMSLLRSFSYRKYVDFSVIDALRQLKEMIRQEVRRRKLDDDVKLGAGGIREVEFIAQVFQLIRGGRETELQDNRLRKILPLLEKGNYLPEGKAQQLLEAYIFLRNCEHAIQAWNDEQSQKLPQTPEAQNALLSYLNINSWSEFEEQLEQYRSLVRREFAELIDDNPSAEKEQNISEDASALWQAASQGLCHIDGGLNCEALHEFSQSTAVLHLNTDSRSRLDSFMPVLLSELEAFENGSDMLLRLLPLVRAVVRRSAYLVLLMENPIALKQLLQLAQASTQICEQLAKHPALLDELLDIASLYHLPAKEELADELRRVMLRIEEDDLEAQMEALRYFKLSHSLRIAACEVTGVLPLMKVSDYLTWLAEALVEYCLGLAWHAMTERHGFPDGEKNCGPSFLISGYGKFGGIEMNHGSDLDLVFIHDANIHGETSGPRVIDNATFYMRLGQKLIHLIDTRTHSGRLYEVDMRLRPSGESGPLVTTLKAFERYQEKEAWTWEHQSLVRARAICGNEQLREKFNATRKKILTQPRELVKLAKDIVDMRLKMRGHLGTKDSESDLFHIKQDAGGIVDIEFMVQYLVLAWSHANPSLATYTDNIRILEALALTDKLSTQEVEQLSTAYKALRVVMHRLTIEQKSNKISVNELVAERNSVVAIWQRLFGTA
ncbi:bifunctional [glutamate--ammonia ligase]-adenylyl-L-tyrosine phosphorylase/[glutamate--ammonia-ligase] adenylyltransferase [Agaribacterium sp. ZY112]|uniref:bifunctional [glutamate--ammonia ligase]-adenylyl-L-tyrosine phosphorylase/[glutamate--ammonia-ligase] adenylyltransferase n=1 Tax=Agaribacterium sp. ZY112 TaxID=3233574 RepID=UPI003526AEE6